MIRDYGNRYRNTSLSLWEKEDLEDCASLLRRLVADLWHFTPYSIPLLRFLDLIRQSVEKELHRREHMPEKEEA